MPRNIASTKNDKPSNANGRPSTSPKRPIRPGHSRPISKLSTVPDTAPMANRTADTLPQRLARPSAAGLVAQVPGRCNQEEKVRKATPKPPENNVQAKESA